MWLILEITTGIGLIGGLIWYFWEDGWIGLIRGLLIAFIGWAIVEWMGPTLFPGLVPPNPPEDKQ